MNQWKNVPLKPFVCQVCGGAFEAKRTAKYCSERCREAARPPRGPRPRSPEEYRKWRKTQMAKPGYRERENRRTNKRLTKVRRWLDAFKLERGCVDCGYSEHPMALDFDHVRGEKTKNVSSATSIAWAQREIEKCEVVCANCHRIRTFRRLQQPSPQ